MVMNQVDLDVAQARDAVSKQVLYSCKGSYLLDIGKHTAFARGCCVYPVFCEKQWPVQAQAIAALAKDINDINDISSPVAL